MYEISLSFERAFERDRIVRPAPEEERVLLLREMLRPCDQLRLERERRLQQRRQVPQAAQPVRLLLGGQPVAQLRERQREQEDAIRAAW